MQRVMQSLCKSAETFLQDDAHEAFIDDLACWPSDEQPAARMRRSTAGTAFQRIMFQEDTEASAVSDGICAGS